MAKRPPVVLAQGKLFELTSPISPAEIVREVQAHGGSVSDAATELKIPESVVRAGWRIHNVTAGRDEDGDGGPVGFATRFFGLFAGIGVVMYTLGALVLAARLAYADLPFEAVVGQLPRNLMLSIGIGQVLIPGIAVGAIYALMRVFFLRGRVVSSWKVGLVAGLWWIGLVLAAFVVANYNGGGFEDPREGDYAFWPTGIAVLALVVMAVAGLRIEYGKGRLSWPRIPWLSLALAYGFVGMAAAALIAATFPLREARACMSSGFSEIGVLVGHGGERVFLGEQRATKKRIVSIPASDVEELFFGPQAPSAICDPRGPAAAVFALQRARRARAQADALRSEAHAVEAESSPDGVTRRALAIAGAATEVARLARQVADAADGIDADQPTHELGMAARDVYEAAAAVLEATASLERVADDLDEPGSLELLKESAIDAAAQAQALADEVERLADDAIAALERASS